MISTFSGTALTANQKICNHQWGEELVYDAYGNNLPGTRKGNLIQIGKVCDKCKCFCPTGHEGKEFAPINFL